MTIQMYNPNTGGVAVTTEEAFDLVWCQGGRGWVKLDEALPELRQKVFDNPADATDNEVRALLTSAGEHYAPVEGETRDSLIARVEVLRQHAESPGDPLAELMAPVTWDPADHTVAEVNDYLTHASEPEKQRVLDLEAKVRKELPDNKQRRDGILNGPHAEFTKED